MRKLILVIALLLLLIVPVFADTTKGETLRLSATVTNCVYIGVTKKALTSSIVPTDTIENIGFEFNVNTGKWETHEAYIYVISFVSNPLQVKISSGGTTLTRITGTSGPETLAYTGSVTPVNSSVTGQTTSSATLPDTEGTVIYLESGTFKVPRVRSWKFSVVVDPSSYTGTSYIPAGNEYEGSFTLTITTVG